MLVAGIRTVGLWHLFSDGERGQAGVVPRWFVTSDGRIRHVEMRLQWTCRAVWFLGCSVQEC